MEPLKEPESPKKKKPEKAEDLDTLISLTLNLSKTPSKKSDQTSKEDPLKLMLPSPDKEVETEDSEDKEEDSEDKEEDPEEEAFYLTMIEPPKKDLLLPSKELKKPYELIDV